MRILVEQSFPVVVSCSFLDNVYSMSSVATAMVQLVVFVFIFLMKSLSEDEFVTVV